MIHFTLIDNAYEKQTLLSPLSEGLQEEGTELLEMAEQMAEDGTEVGCAFFGECFIMRIFDGENYWFSYPVPLDDGIDPTDALLAIAQYTQIQLVDFCLFDVPEEELDFLHTLFPFVDGKMVDEGVFNVQIRNHIMVYDEIPAFHDNDLSIEPLVKEDAEDYYLLMTEPSVNKYYGYDFRSDIPDSSAIDLVNIALAEAERGIALTLAIKLDSKMVGDVVFFNFDFRSSCEIGIRLLPSVWGRGLAHRALALAFRLGSMLELSSFTARVDLENKRALSLVSKLFVKTGEDGGVAFFRREQN